MTLPRIAALLACCSVRGAIAGSGLEVTTPTDAATLRRELVQQIGDAACDTDAQCHSLAIGAKACGGPEAYLAWSDKGTPAAPLIRLAALQRTARELENRRLRLQSDCAPLPDPGAACRPRSGDGMKVCQAAPGGRGDVR